MTQQAAAFPRPRRIPARAWLIMSAVAIAVAVPILPLRFLGIPGPDFPDVSQVVTTSKNWLSGITSRGMDVVEDRERDRSKAGLGSPADQINMLEAAAEQLKASIQQTPNDPALQNRLGLIYLSLGDADKACEYFQKAVSLSRMGITGLNEKISALRSEGRSKEAAVVLLDASKLNVELSAAHSNLARVYEKRGEHDKVIGELDLLNKEGVLFENSAQAQMGTRTTMLNPTVARDLARAEAMMQTRQYQQAGSEYRKILAQDPNIAMAHHRLGTILAMTGNPALAIDELEIAARLDGGSPETQNDLGLAYHTMGLQPQAVKAFERALALEPRMSEAAINLSNIYSSEGRMEEATQVLSQAIASNPNNAKAHNNLGTLFSIEGKYGAALYEFQKAVTLDPQMPSAHYGLGSVLLQTKSYMPAVKEFKQALALNPNFFEAQSKIEECYRKAGLAQAVN